MQYNQLNQLKSDIIKYPLAHSNVNNVLLQSSPDRHRSISLRLSSFALSMWSTLTGPTHAVAWRSESCSRLGWGPSWSICRRLGSIKMKSATAEWSHALEYWPSRLRHIWVYCRKHQLRQQDNAAKYFQFTIVPRCINLQLHPFSTLRQTSFSTCWKLNGCAEDRLEQCSSFWS